MEIGAVVVIPTIDDFSAMQERQPRTSGAAQTICPSRMPILGNDVLRSWMECVRKVGVQNVWLTSQSGKQNVASDLSRIAHQGVERLLMIDLKSYAEIDLADFIRFHRDSKNAVTEAEDVRGRLGVSLIDGNALRSADHKYEMSCARVNSGRPYQFGGYAKRIACAKERQELVGDGLVGACAMRPSGTQIRENVWIGEGAQLADSVRVNGPTYIGARTIVRAGATVGPFASVEHDCVIDCGTAVEQATVLPHTYLAPGLLVRGASVDGGLLEDLSSGVVVDLQPAGLGRRLQRSELQTKTGTSAGTKIGSDVFSRLGASPTWGFTPAVAPAQSWLEVQL